MCVFGRWARPSRGACRCRLTKTFGCLTTILYSTYIVRCLYIFSAKKKAIKHRLKPKDGWMDGWMAHMYMTEADNHLVIGQHKLTTSLISYYLQFEVQTNFTLLINAIYMLPRTTSSSSWYVPSCV